MPQGGNFTTHGMSKHPLFIVWASMRQRCSNPKCPAYPNYGGRGIAVCDRWDWFPNFLEDMGERPSDKHSLDRENVNGDYTPRNCRWATATQQAVGRRSSVMVEVDGESLCLKHACTTLSLSYKAVHSRIRRLGYSPQEAISFPKKKNVTRKYDVSVGGKKVCMKAACRAKGLPYSTVLQRIKVLGWTADKALSEPVRGYSATQSHGGF